MAAAAVVARILLIIVLAGAEFQPHTTVVDLRNLSGKHVLDPNKPNITIGFLSSFKVSVLFGLYAGFDESENVYMPCRVCSRKK